MLRAESWRSWGIGLVFGAATGFLLVLGGPLFLVLIVGVLALAFVAARSLAFLSGMFLGMGGLWLALTVRAQLACDAFDAAPNRGCESSGVGQFLAVCLILLGVGLLLGVAAARRRRDQLA